MEFAHTPATMSRPLRVAIYARVSTTDQNPEAQLSALREFSSRRGFEIHREYVDYVTGDTAKRRRRAPEFDTLMADARKRYFDCVLVWKYDRFARSLATLVAALSEFSALGIDFISHTQNIDTTTPMGRLFFNVIGSFAEFERDIIIDRVKLGLANARAKGIVLGRPIRDPSAAERIQRLREAGLSLRQIGALEKMSASGVRKILVRMSITHIDKEASEDREGDTV